MASLKISGNCLGKGWAPTNDISAFAAAIGQAANLTELDISSNWLTAEDAEILAPAINANGALASLDISNNKLTRGKPNGKSYVHEDRKYDTDMTGVIALAEALKK